MGSVVFITAGTSINNNVIVSGGIETCASSSVTTIKWRSREGASLPCQTWVPLRELQVTILVPLVDGHIAFQFF